MSEHEGWTAPGAEPKPAEVPASPVAPPPGAEVPPPPAPPQPQPQYGQYAPPPAPPQYGQYAPPPAPPQPPYGQNPPPPAPPQPQYGQYAPPQPGYGYAQAPVGGVPLYAQQGVAQPGVPQWAPPPKPGLIPLRPLGFGTLLGAPFQVLRRNPKATFGSGLIVQLIIVVVTALVVGAATIWAVGRAASAYGTPDSATVDAGNVAIILLSLIIPIALSLFASALLQAVLVVEVARATLGEKRRLGELWKAAFKRTLPIVGWLAIIAAAAIVVIAVLAGIIVLGVMAGGAGLAVGIVVVVLLSLGLVVLAAWLGTKLALVPCVIVLEKAGLGTAIRRSWALTNGNFWRTFGALALISIILSFAGQILQVPFSFLLPLAVSLVDPNGSGAGIVAVIVLYFVFLAFTLVIGAVTAVVQAAAVAVIYLDLRMRKEGLDIELQRFVETRQDGLETWPDPYLPRPRG